MAKKKKQKNKETTITDYYDLRTKEVDELVAALKGDVPEDAPPVATNIHEITGEDIKAKPGSKKAEFDPYRRDKLAAIPVWLKACFVKWWFAGCVCYFVMMGLGSHLNNGLDIFFLTGLVLGIIVDLFVNPTFRYLESDRKEYNNYMMFPFPFKAFWTFFTNIIYYFGVVFLVGIISTQVNENITYLPLGPLVFATLTLAVDMIFIGIKDGIVYAVKRAKRKKAEAAMLAAEEAENEGLGDVQADAQAQQKIEERSAEASALDRATAEVFAEKQVQPEGEAAEVQPKEKPDV